MRAISSYHGNRPTHPHRHKHTQDRLKYTAPQCNDDATSSDVTSDTFPAVMADLATEYGRQQRMRRRRASVTWQWSAVVRSAVHVRNIHCCVPRIFRSVGPSLPPSARLVVSHCSWTDPPGFRRWLDGDCMVLSSDSGARWCGNWVCH